MTLPDFLVIGAARAGTTWLDGLLRSHPQVYMPAARKEVHFFDWNYDRGTEWYARHFTGAREYPHVRTVGETTPRYLFGAEIPERIASTLPTCRLLAILRHPVERAYSHYGLMVRDRGTTASFEEELHSRPELLDMSRYHEQLTRYIERFGWDRLHVMIFEEAITDPPKALEPVSSLLGIDPALFHYDTSAVNPSYLPRFPRARAQSKRLSRRLRTLGLNRVVELGKRVESRGVFGHAGPMPPMSSSTRKRLDAEFASEVTAIENLLGRPIPTWRNRHDDA